MFKNYLLFALAIVLFILPFQAHGQSEVAVDIGGDELKSVSKARSLAFTNTTTPMGVGLAGVYLSDNNTVETVGSALAVYGLVVGPSTGNFYAGDYKRGSLGMAVRAVGTYLMADASREIFGNDFANSLGIDDQKVSLTDTKILIGEILVLGSIAYNIFSTQASVEEYNNSRAPVSVQLNSTMVDDKIAPVLTAKLRF